MRWFEADDRYLGAPFFVMDRIDGCRVPADSPPYTVGGLAPRRADARAAPHARRERARRDGRRCTPSTGAALGLDFLDKPQYGRSASSSRCATTRRRSSGPPRASRSPVAAAAARVDPRERARPTTPRSRCAGATPASTTSCSAPTTTSPRSLDWEMVTLADPMMDLGWWLFLDRHFHEGMPRDRALEGFPTREEMVARYEAGERARRARPRVLRGVRGLALRAS